MRIREGSDGDGVSIDALLRALDPNYEAGSWGPEAADELLAREGRKWRRI
jgi:glucose-6-phosphate 1-dehydrogenase